MPTSVLLAVLVAAGLLALAPALVRRYDATERLVAERASTTARVLRRRRRRRTVPGRTPINPPLAMMERTAESGADSAADPAPPRPPVVPKPRVPVDRREWWRRRRRKVLLVLAALCLAEAAAAALVGPGFLVGLGASLTLCLWYVGVLRNRVISERRARRLQARVAARRAAEQAARERIEAEKRRRIAEARRAAQARVREHDGPWWPTTDPADVPEPRRSGLRGQAYEARAANF